MDSDALRSPVAHEFLQRSALGWCAEMREHQVESSACDINLFDAVAGPECAFELRYLVKVSGDSRCQLACALVGFRVQVEALDAGSHTFFKAVDGRKGLAEIGAQGSRC